MLKVVILSIVLLSNSFAKAGRDGSGGNDLAQEFAEIAQLVHDSLKHNKSLYHNFGVYKLESLKKALSSAKILAVKKKLCTKREDTSCPNEAGFVAKNYPEENLIEVNEEKWSELNGRSRNKIAIHEYFALALIEDTNYFHSSRFKIADREKSEGQYMCTFHVLEKQENSLPTTLLQKNFFYKSSKFKVNHFDISTAGLHFFGSYSPKGSHSFTLYQAKTKKKFEIESGIFLDRMQTGTQIYKDGDISVKIGCNFI